MAPRRLADEGGAPGTMLVVTILLVGSMPGLAAGIASPADATSPPTTTPSQPRNLTAERGPYAVHLDWDPPEEGTAGIYQVYYRQGGGAWENASKTVRGTSYNHSGAPLPDSGATLEYKVAARFGGVTPAEPVEETWPFVRVTNPRSGDVTTCGPTDVSYLTCQEDLAGGPRGLRAATCKTDRAGLSQDRGSPAAVFTCDAALVHGEATVTALVLSPARIEEATFLVDGTVRHVDAGTEGGNSFEWHWEVHDERMGARQLTVAARDAEGRRASQTMDVFTTRISTGSDPVGADAWAEADGLGAGAAVGGKDTGPRGPATGESSEGCAGANATLQYGDFGDEREAGRCLEEDPRQGSVEVVLHGTVLELDLGSVTAGDLASWFRGTGSAPYELRFAPETRLCAGIVIDGRASGEEPLEASSCQARPLAEGRYEVSLLVDGLWVNLTAPDRRFPPLDPGGVTSGNLPLPEFPDGFVPSAGGMLEDDPLRRGCYGARVHTPATGTVAFVTGEACRHPERSLGG